MIAELSGWLWIPKKFFGDLKNIKNLKKRLTFRPKKLGDSLPVPIPMYSETENAIGVPPYWGLRQNWHILVEEKTTKGEPFKSVCTRPDHNHSAVSEPAVQKQFLDSLEAYVTEEHNGFLCFRAEAPTGTGKTVCAAWVAGGVLKRKTLILSHMLRVNEQWLETFRDILGVPEDRIGMIRADRKDWKDKDVVIATLQTIALHPGSLPDEFYKSFGCVIIDETHRCGAEKFSQAMWQFPAEVKFGLSATHERKDGAHKVIEKFLGGVEVKSKAIALPLKVYPIWYTSRSKMWGDTHGTRMLCLSRDKERNYKIVDTIRRMYESGRQAIIVSESVKHLELLINLCMYAGIPKTVMGQFTAHRNTAKRIKAGDRWQDVNKKVKTKAKELEKIKHNSQLIFASYGMIKEGVDIPRLDCGIDVTPRSDAVQLIGRLRRPFPGKKEPVLWVTIVDRRCNRSLRYYQSRLKDYKKSNAEVISLND